MIEQRYANLKLGERGAIVSIVAYVILSSFKWFIGTSTGSEALVADGLNNATDIVASIAVLVGLRLARRPADNDHPYGHWKAETVASLIASFIMMAVGLKVLLDAGLSVVQGKQHSPDMLAAWTGLVCAVIMFLVYRYNRNLARKINSQAVMAAAKDNLSDAYVSIGAAVGIFGSQLGLPWLDSLTAFAVGIIICLTAWGIFREASHHLTDGFDETAIDGFRETVLGVDGVQGVKEIRARNYGSNAVVDIILLMDASLPFGEAHEIATRVEDILKSTSDVYEVHVHYEPMELRYESTI